MQGYKLIISGYKNNISSILLLKENKYNILDMIEIEMTEILNFENLKKYLQTNHYVFCEIAYSKRNYKIISSIKKEIYSGPYGEEKTDRKINNLVAFHSDLLISIKRLDNKILKLQQEEQPIHKLIMVK